MERKHPKRKKDQQNNYVLEIVNNNDYLLSFVDGEGIAHSLTIDEQLYGLFNLFELEDISYMNEISRHYEYSVLSEHSIDSRALIKSESLEDEVIKKIEYQYLYKAITKLSPVQKRRLIMHFFGGMTYERIACIEGCSKGAIEHSINIAKTHIKEDLSK